MPRPFWQVVEDPDYIEDWDSYFQDEEDRQRGCLVRVASDQEQLSKLKNSRFYEHDKFYDDSKFFD
jgi:hypothetical protein